MLAPRPGPDLVNFTEARLFDLILEVLPNENRTIDNVQYQCMLRFLPGMGPGYKDGCTF